MIDKNEEKMFNTSKTIEMADYKFIRGDYSDDVYHDLIRKFYNERFAK